MSMIIEKRNEVARKLETLMAERNISITRKVEAYRLQLESQPLSDEITNTRKLLTALDEVVACEAIIETTPKQEPVVVNNTPETVITIAETDIKAIEEVDEIPSEAEVVDCIEVVVNPETQQVDEVKAPIEEARPGMAYVGIPERR